MESPLPLLQILLPVGISFYTFMGISYIVDVYRRQLEPAGWLDTFLYLSFFPHLVAGPIVRGAELFPQFAKRRDPKHVDFSRAAYLIFAGLFKKVVLSSYLATTIVDPVFGDPGAHSSSEILVAVYGYAVQIYADFSGYTDIAIGIALLLGFEFPQNFDRPYTARSLQDFWRRWHMTLSRWLRDYLYIPLGGSRRGKLRTYLNIFITMLLGGLWHGAAWNFVVWGGIQGAGQVIGHARRDRRAERGLPEPEDTPRRRAVERFVTFHIVCLGWIFFRAGSIGGAFAHAEGAGDPMGAVAPRHAPGARRHRPGRRRPVPAAPAGGAAHVEVLQAQARGAGRVAGSIAPDHHDPRSPGGRALHLLPVLEWSRNASTSHPR